MKNFKIILVGDSQSGKTSLITKLRTGLTPNTYIPTLGVEVHPFLHKNMRLNIWDCAGQERFGILRNSYFLQADLCIILYKNETNPIWEMNFKKINPDKPILFIKNVTTTPTNNNEININTGEGLTELLLLLENYLN
jgi:small GTP-binding protein